MQRTFAAIASAAATLALLAAGCSWTTSALTVEPPPIALSSFIYDKDGEQITLFRGEQHRVNIEDLSEVPALLQNAVVAIEDERFWQHSGIDLRAILRAGLSNINQGGVSEGGSTITQQYVGLVFLDRTDQSASRKIEELALARQFEDQYTKEFILKEYLNLVYFGEGAYGVRAAADEYFNKTLAELTISEAAILAGLIQAPATYNPYDNLDAALLRRKQVLDRMLINNYISQKEYDQARTEPVRLAPRVEVLEATYDAPYFVEEVRQWILSNPRFGETRQDRVALLFEGGLHIHTTVDRQLQKRAEAAVANVLTDEVTSDDPSGPTAAVILIENDTGYVRAMVGGQDFFGDDPSARFNLATQGGRQAGSAFKPLILAAALEQGIQMGAQYPAPEEIVIENPPLPDPWEVEGGANGGTVSLAEATIRSVNTVYAQLMEDVGAQAGVDMATRLGVESSLQPVLSAVLGTNDVTALDMANAFSTIARRGILVEPAFVSKVIGPGGEIIYEHSLESERVLAADVADQITDVLRQAVDTGTGRRAQLPGHEAAGKTGTAEDFRDATFSGFTSEYTASVWVGFPQGQIEMEPPNTPIEVYGGTYPALIWQGVMSAAHDETSGGAATRSLPRPPVTITTIPENQQTAVPDVAGLTEAAARQRVQESRLVPYATYFYAPDAPDSQIGRVRTQAPEPDEIVDADGWVTIQIYTDLPEEILPTQPEEPGGIDQVSPQDSTQIVPQIGPQSGAQDGILPPPTIPNRPSEIPGDVLLGPGNAPTTLLQ